MRLVVVTESEALYALSKDWQRLADLLDSGSFFAGPRWLMAWWRSYQRQLAAELYVLSVFDEDSLIGLAPFYRRQSSRPGGGHIEEIRLLGDAGPRPPALDLLSEPGREDVVGISIAEHLLHCLDEWDVIDLQPLREPSRVRAVMVSRLNAKGRTIDSNNAGGAQCLGLLPGTVDVSGPSQSVASHEQAVQDPAEIRNGLAVLRRLSRLEWGDREEMSPYADPQATHLFEDVVLELAAEQRARLTRLNDDVGQASAIALVIDEGSRAVVVALAADPEVADAPAHLLTRIAQEAATRDCLAVDVCAGGRQYKLPNMPVTRQRALRLRVYGSSSGAALARTYSKVRARVERVTEAPYAAAAGARAAWSKIRTAASSLAGFDRMHLYRGELWTRGLTHTPGLSMETFSLDEYEKLRESDRESLRESLELTDKGLKETWARGDMAVLARINGRPAGIAWCARKRVFVPEIDHWLELGPGEAYIHDLFVAPQARGRAVAPSMLEFLSHTLRQLDVYKSWALVGSDNVASVRALEKGAYAAVADVIRAHVSGVGTLVVRPPDPEAKKLLGL